LHPTSCILVFQLGIPTHGFLPASSFIRYPAQPCPAGSLLSARSALRRAMHACMHTASHSVCVAARPEVIGWWLALTAPYVSTHTYKHASLLAWGMTSCLSVYEHIRGGYIHTYRVGRYQSFLLRAVTVEKPTHLTTVHYPYAISIKKWGHFLYILLNSWENF
jgi:hypothetical protein